MINFPLIILAFMIGYAVHRVLLNLGGKAVYSEQDMKLYGEERFQAGYENGYSERRTEDRISRW